MAEAPGAVTDSELLSNPRRTLRQERDSTLGASVGQDGTGAVAPRNHPGKNVRQRSRDSTVSMVRVRISVRIRVRFSVSDRVDT